MLRGSRQDVLDGRPRPCRKRYIAGYEPEYEECRLKFRENSRHRLIHHSPNVNSHRKLLPKTPASPDIFFLAPQPAHKYPFIEHPPKPHPAAFTGTSGPAGHPFPAVFQPDELDCARRARHSLSVLGLPRWSACQVLQPRKLEDARGT